MTSFDSQRHESRSPDPKRAALWQAILDDFYHDEPRLVFADYLEEQGDPYGEFVRLQVELDKLNPETKPWIAVNDRAQKLFQQYGDRWNPIPKELREKCTVSYEDFRRGLLYTMHCDEGMGDDELKRLSAVSEIVTIRFEIPRSITNEGIASLKDLPELRVLDVSGTQVSDDLLPILKTFPKLCWLCSYWSEISPEALDEFDQHSLEQFRALQGNAKQMEAAIRLRLPKGREDTTCTIQLDDHGDIVNYDDSRNGCPEELEYLAAIDGIQEIVINNRYTTDEAIQRFLQRTDARQNLRHLRFGIDLELNDSTLQCIAQLTRLEVLILGIQGHHLQYLSNLKTLRVLHCVANDQSLSVLANLPELEVLSLCGDYSNHIFAQLGLLPKLKCLRLLSNNIAFDEVLAFQQSRPKIVVCTHERLLKTKVQEITYQRRSLEMLASLELPDGWGSYPSPISSGNTVFLGAYENIYPDHLPTLDFPIGAWESARCELTAYPRVPFQTYEPLRHRALNDIAMDFRDRFQWRFVPPETLGVEFPKELLEIIRYHRDERESGWIFRWVTMSHFFQLHCHTSVYRYDEWEPVFLHIARSLEIHPAGR